MPKSLFYVNFVIDALPVLWMDVYPFRLHQSKSLSHLDDHDISVCVGTIQRVYVYSLSILH